MNTSKIPKELFDLNLTNMTSKEISSAIAEISAKHKRWFRDLSRDQYQAIMGIVMGSCPHSLSYDEVATVVLHLLAFAQNLTHVPKATMAFAGLGVDPEDNQRAIVVDTEKFWSHYITIATKSKAMLKDDLVVRYFTKFPSRIIGTRNWLQVFTDPHTDFNHDDSKSIVYIENMRKITPGKFWEVVNYVICAKGGLQERIGHVKQLLHKCGTEPTESHVVAYGPHHEINSETSKFTRFYPSYALGESEGSIVFGRSYVECVDVHLGRTDAALWIGQVGKNFAMKFFKSCTTMRIRSLVIQGPGFNTMGWKWGKMYPLMDKVVYGSFAFVDAAGAATVDWATYHRLMAIMQKYDTMAITNSIIITISFMMTDSAYKFPNQFKGWDYAKHFPLVMKHFVPEKEEKRGVKRVRTETI